MNFRRELTLLAISVFMPFLTQAQEFKLKSQILDNPENEPVNVYPVPHDRQVKWMETEFYALSILVFCIVLIISIGRSRTGLNVPKCFQWVCKWETS